MSMSAKNFSRNASFSKRIVVVTDVTADIFVSADRSCSAEYFAPYDSPDRRSFARKVTISERGRPVKRNHSGRARDNFGPRDAPVAGWARSRVNTIVQPFRRRGSKTTRRRRSTAFGNPFPRRYPARCSAAVTQLVKSR